LSKLQKLWKSRGASTALSTEVLEGGQAAAKVIEKALPSIDDIATSAMRTKQALRQVESQLNMFPRHIQSALNTAKRANPQMAAQYESVAAKMVEKISEANKLMASDPVAAKRILEEQMALLNQIPDINIPGFNSIANAKNALGNAHGVLTELGDVYALTSKNIGNRTKFLNEYLSAYKKYGPDYARNKWLASPANAKYYDELMRSGRLEDIIQSLQGTARKIPFKQRLKGLTWTDVLTRLGLGAGAAAATSAAGVAKVFTWFDESSSDVGSKAQGLENSMMALENATSGDGKAIVQAANRSLANINRTSMQAMKMMENNMPDAVNVFVRSVGTEQATLAGALNQWDKVAASSSNPQLAQQAYGQLKAFADNIEAKLKKLGANVGVKVREPGDQFSEAANISQVQEALNLPPTGKIDVATVNALKQLESKLNQAAETNEFTGYFYNPALNHIISYQDLLNAKQRLEKY